MPMTGLERWAAIRSAAVLKEMTMCEVARSCGVSYNRFVLVAKTEERKGSAHLQSAIADFLGRSVRDVWGSNVRAVA